MSGTEEKARAILLRLDPFVRLDDGPRIVDRVPSRASDVLCDHAPGYHQDPYGVLFRNDVRLSEWIELIGWDIVRQVPEVVRLMAEATELIEEGKL